MLETLSNLRIDRPQCMSCLPMRSLPICVDKDARVGAQVSAGFVAVGDRRGERGGHGTTPSASLHAFVVGVAWSCLICLGLRCADRHIWRPVLHMSTWSRRQETCRGTSHNRFGNSSKVSAEATNPSRHVALAKGVVGPYRSGLILASCPSI